MRIFEVLVYLVAVVLATGCKKEEKTVTPLSQGPAKTNHIFLVKGVIKEIKPDRKTAIIQHEEIPNYMPAMSMPLDVKDTNEFQGLIVGDAVSFRMIVTDDDGWIDQVKKVSRSEVKISEAPPATRIAPDVEPLNVGDSVPNYTFTNELNQPVAFADLKGTAYAITFIFTRCPFPDFCPRMGRHFADAYKQIRTNASFPSNWKLLTLSFDPEFDTPRVLNAYAKQWNYDPAKWSFVTGSLKDIDAITEQFGLVFPRSAQGFDHNLRTVVIDARGKVHHIFVGNAWSPDELVEKLGEAAVIKPG